MFGTLSLLQFAGAVALLLWGTHMVTTGVARGFGAPLQSLIGRGLDSRASACLIGAAVTALLQSSTATALIATSLAASGTLELPAGIALMLGANVGTALVVQVLSFDVAAAAPVLILLGYVSFRARSGRTRPRNAGRMLIGLGLMLTALSLLGRTLADVEGAPILREVVQALGSDPILSVAAAAGLAWAAHSSVAVVLFVVSLAGSGALALDGTLALVLGANLGAALAPYLEAGASAAARRLPLANLLVRAAGCAVALPLLPSIGRGLTAIGAGDPSRAALSLHVGLNVALAAAVLPWTSSLARLVRRLLPDPVREDGNRDGTARDGLPRHLDPASLPTPGIALANATLEALHMADLAGEILRDAFPALRAGDGALAAAVGRRDAAVVFLRTLRDLRRVQSHVAALCGPLLERRDAPPPGEGEDAAGGGVLGRDGGDGISGVASHRPLPTV